MLPVQLTCGSEKVSGLQALPLPREFGCWRQESALTTATRKARRTRLVMAFIGKGEEDKEGKEKQQVQIRTSGRRSGIQSIQERRPLQAELLQ